MHIKSIISGLVYFAIMSLAQLLGAQDISKSFAAPLMAVLLFMWISTGYIIASIAKERIYTNATITALVITCLAALFATFTNFTSSKADFVAIFLVSTTLFFVLGAFIWHLQKMLTTKHPN